MEYKTCTKCREHKPLTEFHKAKRTKDGHQYSCKVCKSKMAKDDRETNPDKYKERSANYWINNKETVKQWREDNKERYQGQIDAWHAAHRERVREHARNCYHRHIDRRRIECRNWQRANRPTTNAALARYRARKLRATVCWANNLKIKTIYAKSSRLSIWMGSKFDVDHMVPLQSDLVCGLHNEFNLQILPTLENKSKSNRWWPNMWEKEELLPQSLATAEQLSIPIVLNYRRVYHD